MSKEKIFIFDTTLRDGAQTEGVNFSIDDKNKIAKAFSNLGVDYLEGGWPGANTLDTTFFNKPPKLGSTILTAFGMTKKAGRSAQNARGFGAVLTSVLLFSFILLMYAICSSWSKTISRFLVYPPSSIFLLKNSGLIELESK